MAEMQKVKVRRKKEKATTKTAAFMDDVNRQSRRSRSAMYNRMSRAKLSEMGSEEIKMMQMMMKRSSAWGFFLTSENKDMSESIFSASDSIDKPDAAKMGHYPALRILEPARKKLCTLDTQRIMWCLDECIRQHQILTGLLMVVFRNKGKLDELKVTLGVELHKALIPFKTLHEKVNKLYGSQSPNLPEMEGKICESCKEILRLFQPNQAAIKAVIALIPENIAIPGGRKFHQPKKVIQNLLELRQQMLSRLLTTPIECKERARYLTKVEENERSNNVLIEKLEKQLEDAIKDKEAEVARKNDQIKKLKNDLHQIEEFSSENMKSTKRQSEIQKATDQRESDGKMTKLNYDYDLANNVYEKMFQEHRAAEQKLRKKKYKIETEVENWITKYDQEMTEKQDEYEEIDAVYTEEKKQLNELEEKFQVLAEEYDKIMEERRIERERREAADKDYKLKKEAATIIQAYFRAYKVRKVLKAAKAGKGGRHSKRSTKGKSSKK